MSKLGKVSKTLSENFDEDLLLQEPVSVWKRTYKRLLSRRSGKIGLFLIGFIFLIAFTAPIIAPYDPHEVLIGKEVVKLKKREGPCIHILGCDSAKPQHLMGIDGNYRDQYSRIIYGSRISLSIGFSTVSFAVIGGVLLGALAAFFGGWIDNIIMRLMDVILGFPSLLLAIAIVAVLGPGIRNALLAIAIVTLPAYARLTRASVLTVKELDFVKASITLGASPTRLLIFRILPNSLTPVVVLATLGVATAILDAAGLSFLGLGAQPPMPEWGTMLGSERNQVFSAPHLVFFPGIAIMITVLAFNLFGDGLRDALDPRLND